MGVSLSFPGTMYMYMYILLHASSLVLQKPQVLIHDYINICTYTLYVWFQYMCVHTCIHVPLVQNANVLFHQTCYNHKVFNHLDVDTHAQSC